LLFSPVNPEPLLKTIVPVSHIDDHFWDRRPAPAGCWWTVAGAADLQYDHARQPSARLPYLGWLPDL